MLLDEIPSLDLADFRSSDPTRKAKFVEDLGQAFNTIGFVAIKGHGLSEQFTESLYQHVETFFKSTDEKKKAYEIPGIFGQRGYVGKGKETAKGFNVPDLKEFYHVGQPFKEDGDSVWDEYPANVFPDEFPDFEKLRSLVIAVNEEYQEDGFILSEKDEIVIIPPVSGG